MDNELGKVGYRIARKINDKDYGSYEVVSWCEQSYSTTKEKEDLELTIPAACKAVLFKDVLAIQKKIDSLTKV